MYEIVSANKTVDDVKGGQFFIIKSPQSYLDKQEYSFKTGDLFLRMSDDSSDTVVFIASRDEKDMWAGSSFDVDHPMFEELEVEVILPKKIVIHV